MSDISIWNGTVGKPVELFFYEDDGVTKTGYIVDGKPLVFKYEEEEENNG